MIKNQFEEEDIEQQLQKFQVDEKYKGLDHYEWKQTEKKQFVDKKRGRGRGTNYRARGSRGNR